MLRGVEPASPTLDSRLSAFWIGRPLHLAELGVDLQWHGEGRLEALLRLTGGCMDTTVAVALAFLRQTEHWPALAASVRDKLRRNSLGDQTSLLRDLNQLLPPSLQLALDEPAPELGDFARKVLPKNTPRSGPVTLQQGLEALVAWRNAQVHPSASPIRAQLPYDEAESALLAVVERTPALGLRLYSGTAFGTTPGGSVGLRMTSLSWPGPRPYRKGECVAVEGEPQLDHVLTMDERGRVLDLHPFLSFDGRKLCVFQCFQGGSGRRREAGRAVVWHPKSRELDEEAGAEVDALFRAVPAVDRQSLENTKAAPTDVGEPVAAAENEVGAVQPPQGQEPAPVTARVSTDEARSLRTTNPGGVSGVRLVVAGIGAGLVVLTCLLGVGLTWLQGSDEDATIPAAGPIRDTSDQAARSAIPLLSAVVEGLHWGDTMETVIRSTAGARRPSGRGPCEDEVWRHVTMPVRNSRISGATSAHAWIDSEVGLFELNVFVDPAREALPAVVALLTSRLGAPRIIHARRYPEPVSRWDRGPVRLNATLTPSAEAALTDGVTSPVIVRVFHKGLQPSATSHKIRVCADR